MSGRTNRNKGHNAERFYVKVFKKMGYSFCKTARYASKVYDDCGVDLVNLPFLVQIKAGKQKGLNKVETLRIIEERMKKEFPAGSKENSMPKILIHKKDVGRGKKRTEYDEIVTMTFSDFQKILKLTNDN